MAKSKIDKRKRLVKPKEPTPQTPTQKQKKAPVKRTKAQIEANKASAIKKFYDSFGVIINDRKALKNEKIYNLFKVPSKEKGANMPHIQTREPGQIVQADLLFLPKDDGYRYALVVVDCGNRAVDAEPVKVKESEQVLAAFKKIFTRKIVKQPAFQIQVDAGNEFKGEVKKYYESKNIFVRAAQVGRHRQVALVEGMNGILGKALLMRQAAQEMQTGEISTEWILFLPKVIAAMNEHLKLDKPREVTTDIPCKGDACKILPEGTPVRVALDRPINALEETLSGKFRKADIRFDKTPRTIEHVLLMPDLPPMYRISGKHNVAYTKNQLQVLPTKENIGPDEYIHKFKIEKIIGKKTNKKGTFYHIKWFGYPDPTWQPAEEIEADVPTLVTEFEKMNTKK